MVMELGDNMCCSWLYVQQTTLNEWLKWEPFDHKPETKSDCSCQRWYNFHRLPQDDKANGNWIKSLNLKKLPQTLYICSSHFVDKKPMLDNPYPTPSLGYERPPEKKSCRLIRTHHVTTTGESGEMEVSEEPGPI
ncbi:uncharacterized protein si:ch211-113p18.3 [Lampris incognitus]|uniref:uncharacterized protein si:ch211-113p18.3 n=1 Tax=Lampris incognitus TaxID=2546036 RepID=UPI0024B5F71C|nr:uncharacterized protein si:ch211-113p18.3 [Lampris incognitus]